MSLTRIVACCAQRGRQDADDGAPWQAHISVNTRLSVPSAWPRHRPRRCCRYGNRARRPSGQWRLSGSMRQRPPGSGLSLELCLSSRAGWPLGWTTRSSNRTAKSTCLRCMDLCRILIAGRPGRATGTIRQRHGKMPIASLRNLYPPPTSWLEIAGPVGPVDNGDELQSPADASGTADGRCASLEVRRRTRG
jgi:hypothetical protein